MSPAVVLTLVVLCLLLENGLACRCQISHLHMQQLFCKAEFVIQAEVTGEKILYQNELDSDGNVISTPVTRVYFIRIRRLFKTTEIFDPQTNQTFDIGFQEKIYTNYHGSLCGVNLRSNTYYLLSGHIGNGQLYINLCHWHQEWSTLTAKQVRGITNMFIKNCDCQIQLCWKRHCTKSKNTLNPDSCQLHPMDFGSLCYNKEAHCLRRKTTNKCLWSRGESWKRCDKEAREERLR